MIRLFLMAGLAWVGCCSLSANDFLEFEELKTVSQSNNAPMVLVFNNCSTYGAIDCATLSLRPANHPDSHIAYPVYKVTEGALESASFLSRLPIVCVESNLESGAVEIFEKVLANLCLENVRSITLRNVAGTDCSALQEILHFFQEDTRNVQSHDCKVFIKRHAS